ncbi:MAG: GNAT family N-acetyltransferase [Candidatus Saccharimonas sp.]
MKHERAPQFTIELMRPEDVAEATEMRLQSWLDTYPNDSHGVSREWIEAHNEGQRSDEKHRLRLERFALPNTKGWVARDLGGKIIGATNPYTDDNGVQHVGSLYVDKDFHGRGVGSALMKKVVEYFNSTKPIELSVASYNDRAQAFYRKWGFEEIPDSESMFADMIPEIKMLRKG